jgi:hypothetical protein
VAKLEGTDTAKRKDEGFRVPQNVQRGIFRAVCVLLVCVIIGTIIGNSPLLYTKVNAVSIGEHKLSAAEYNYYFRNVYSTMNQQYGGILSYYIDSSKPLSSQDSMEDGQNWEEYLRDRTVENLQRMYMLTDEAAKAGFTDVGDNDPAETMATLRRNASQNGYTDFEEYLEDAMGKGMNEAALVDALTKSAIAAAYRDKIGEEQKATYTDTDLDEKYTEIAADYNRLNYYKYDISNSLFTDEGGVQLENAAAKALVAAEAIAAAHSGEDFEAAVLKQVPTADVSALANYNVASSSLSVADDQKEWLTSSERNLGDTKYFTTDSGLTVLLYAGASVNDYYPIDYYDITVAGVADADVAAGAEADTSAADAEKLRSEWEDGLKSDNQFDYLYKTYSTDKSYENGLRTNRILGNSGQKDIDDWLFDSSRKANDWTFIHIDAIRGSDGSVTTAESWHLLRFKGTTEDSIRVDREYAQTALLNDWFEDWTAEREASYAFTTSFGYNFRVKKL